MLKWIEVWSSESELRKVFLENLFEHLEAFETMSVYAKICLPIDKIRFFEVEIWSLLTVDFLQRVSDRRIL